MAVVVVVVGFVAPVRLVRCLRSRCSSSGGSVNAATTIDDEHLLATTTSTPTTRIAVGWPLEPPQRQPRRRLEISVAVPVVVWPASPCAGECACDDACYL